jgi:HlyD family secretion protein
MISRKALRVTLGVALAGGSIVAVAALGQLRSRGIGGGLEIPTTRVKRGDIALKVYTTGELRPTRSGMMVAPPVAGTLQIVHLAPTGTRVKAGDVVLEFDPSEQEFNLEQNRYDLRQAEQEITKLKASSAVQVAEDQVALLKAKFDVRRAELEVLKKDFISAIDAQKNDLTLEEAKRHVAQLEQDVPSREASNRSAMAVLEEKRNKARLAMSQAEKNIQNMRLTAAFSGLVAVKENRDASGGIFFGGMTLPEYRQGDLVFSGRFVAEVLEVDQMEIQAKISESDRGNVNPGQPVEVRLDAIPGRTFRGTVKNVAGAASRNMWGGDPMRRFDATFQLDGQSAAAPASGSASLRPGVTVQVIILGDQIRNALYLPRQALFDKDSQPIVYIRRGSNFEPQKVTIKNRTESFVVVEGVGEGTEVALINPEEQGKRQNKGPAGPAGVAGGGR